MERGSNSFSKKYLLLVELGWVRVPGESMGCIAPPPPSNYSHTFSFTLPSRPIPTHTGIIPTERLLTTITTFTSSSSFLPLPLHRQPMPPVLPPPRDLGIESPGETAPSRWQPPDTSPPLWPRPHQRNLSSGGVPKMTTAPRNAVYLPGATGENC